MQGFSAAPRKIRGGFGDGAAGEERLLVAHGAERAEQRDRVEIEHRLGARLVADPDAVAGEAEDVSNPHGGRTEHVALNGDAVAVAARDLEHRAVADPGEQRADTDRGHVAVGAGSIGGIDRVDHFGQWPGGVVDVFRVGGVRRIELGGDRETPLAQDPFEP